MKKWLNEINLAWIVYPIAILATGVPTLINFYNLVTRNQPVFFMLIVYLIVFALVTVGFIYLALKKVKLNFKLSFLSVVGIILIIIFTRGIVEYTLGGHSFSEFLLIGSDHWLFPIAFGFFFLCDLSKIPKKFWFFLLPLALMAIITADLNVIANVFFETNIFPGPAFFHFFGVSNWEGLHALSNQQFINGLREFLQEFLTFFTLFPIVIFYYALRKQKPH